MFITKYKTIFISLAVVLVAVSLISVKIYGIKKGVDFTGGTVVEFSFVNNKPEIINEEELKKADINIYDIGEGNYKLVSTKSYDEIKNIAYPIVTEGKYQITENNLSSIGPSLGEEMTKKAITAIFVVIIMILLFIAFSFREVSYPVSSWKYGTVAMVTLIHDIIVPTGAYVWLSNTQGAQIDTLFIIALLTIIGISISDKIVVFDRIRENLKINSKRDFEEVVGISLKQTFTRSINTSVTVILALIALYFYGPVSTEFFSLTLIVGMIIGTYSSIFVASPLLVVWNNLRKSK